MKLILVAQNIMDLYFQDYAPRDAYYDLDDFMSMASIVYAKLLNDEFQLKKQEMKLVEGFSYVDISPEWLITKDFAITREGNAFVVNMDEKVFAFDFDALTSGVQRIEVIEGKPGRTVKISFKDSEFMDRLPMTTLYFYYVLGANKIFFKNRYPKKVKVYYIPAVTADDSEAEIPDSKVLEVITTTLQLYFGSKNGEVIDTSNDSNKNKAPATELNPDKIR